MLRAAIRRALAPAATEPLIGIGQPGCVGEFTGDGHEIACGGIRLAPSGTTYYVGLPESSRDFHLYVFGTIFAKQAVLPNNVTIGDPRDGTGVAFVEGGEIVRGIRQYVFGLTGRAYDVLSTNGYVESTSEATLTRDAAGAVAVIAMPNELLAVANITAEAGGGYEITTLTCSAACSLPLWWSKAESTESHIVIRSGDPNATSFVFTIRALRQKFTRTTTGKQVLPSVDAGSRAASRTPPDRVPE